MSWERRGGISVLVTKGSCRGTTLQSDEPDLSRVKTEGREGGMKITQMLRWLFTRGVPSQFTDFSEYTDNGVVMHSLLPLNGQVLVTR
jgi:hypothetical protein